LIGLDINVGGAGASIYCSQYSKWEKEFDAFPVRSFKRKGRDTAKR